MAGASATACAPVCTIEPAWRSVVRTFSIALRTSERVPESLIASNLREAAVKAASERSRVGPS
jgi:hypothetical protein